MKGTWNVAIEIISYIKSLSRNKKIAWYFINNFQYTTRIYKVFAIKKWKYKPVAYLFVIYLIVHRIQFDFMFLLCTWLLSNR